MGQKYSLVPRGFKLSRQCRKLPQILDGMGGSAGLLPTLAAINAGKDIAFVNKEVMVMAGPLVNAAVKTNGVNLIPIDGEMSAIFQCLEGAARPTDGYPSPP